MLLCVLNNMEISSSKLLTVKVIALVAFIELSLLAGFGFMVISDFESLFQSFGGPVPYITELYFHTYKFWGVLAIFPLLTLVQSFTHKQNFAVSFLPTLSILITLGVLGMIIFLFTVFTMYAPIFEMGEAL